MILLTILAEVEENNHQDIGETAVLVVGFIVFVYFISWLFGGNKRK